MPTPTYQTGGYIVGLTAGTQVSSTGEGRHLNLLESTLTHPTHTDGFVDKGDPIVTASGNIVGVAFNSAAAATDYVNVDTEGLWNLSVVGTDHNGNSAVVIGDEIFIHRTTGVLSKNINVNTHRHFGYALGAVVSAATTVIAVKVHWDPDDEAIVKVGADGAEFVHDEANYNFHEYRFDNGATSGDNRGFYLRLLLTGAGTGGGESLRAFTTIDDVRMGTAHGAHISLNFGDTGSLSGLAVAGRNTLHIPNQAFTGLPGTYAAVQAEIWSDGANSDPVGMTELSFIRVVNGGNAGGVADVDDDANLLVITGGAIGGGNMVQADVDETKFSHKIRCNIHGTVMYLMAADS